MARLAKRIVLLCRQAAAQCRSDLRERRIEAAGKHLHAGDAAEGDQSRSECIFDQILAAFILMQSAEYAANFYVHDSPPLKRMCGKPGLESGNPESLD
jgi:hypothetical protein